MSQICAQFVWAVGQRQMKGKFYILSTLHNHRDGTGFRTHGQEGLPAETYQIPELIMGTGSNDSLCGVVATEDEEYCAEVLPQHLRLLANTQHVQVLRLHSAWIQPF